MPDRLKLTSHRCTPKWDFSDYMGGDRLCWVGEITVPPDEYPQEKYCIHVRTAEKPPMVFGLNRGDVEFLSAICYGILLDGWGDGFPVQRWIESILSSASDPESVEKEAFQSTAGGLDDAADRLRRAAHDFYLSGGTVPEAQEMIRKGLLLSDRELARAKREMRKRETKNPSTFGSE